MPRSTSLYVGQTLLRIYGFFAITEMMLIDIIVHEKLDALAEKPPQTLHR